MHQNNDSSPVLTAFGERLRVLRNAAGLTQQTLATRAGMERKSVNRAEGGRHGLSVPAVVALAAALGTTPGALLDGLSPTHRPSESSLPAPE